MATRYSSSIQPPVSASPVSATAAFDARPFSDQAETEAEPSSKRTLKDQRSSPLASIQPKLTIGAPGDPYEQEADRIADQVMAMPDPGQTQVQRMQEPEEEELQMKPSGESIQRLASLEEDDELQMKSLGGSIQKMQNPEEDELLMKPLANSIQRMQGLEEEELQMQSLGSSIQRMQNPEEEEELQMKAADASAHDASPDLETSLNQSKGGGAALDDATRSFIEPRLGFDFSRVRIHNDSQAVQMNEQLGARAFTHGSDIYFGAGQYNPGSDDGKRLLSHELTHVVQQTAGSETLQRDPLPPGETLASATDTPAPTTDPDRALAERIMATISLRGGITVAVYAASAVGSAGEFRRQANQYADDHRAIGLAGGSVREGTAMEMDSGIPGLLASLTQQINDLMARYPDLSGGMSHQISIQNLAIFTHGGRTQLQAGAPNRRDPGKNQWIRNSLGSWVEALAPFLSSSPRVLLYACSVAGQPPEGMPFAEAMRQALQTALEARYGEDAGVAPEVWGHETAGHTTANSRVVGFGGGAESSAGDNLQQLFIRKLTDRIAEDLGGLPTMTPSKQRQFQRAVTRAVANILRASTSRLAPTNAYIREIPQMGIDRVWRDISSPSSPNLSDLDLTDDARSRVAAGLAEYQGRFARHLSRLIALVRTF